MTTTDQPAEPDPTAVQESEQRLIYCPGHGHYLVRASVLGTQWTFTRSQARTYPVTEVADVLRLATWLEHNPEPVALDHQAVAS